MNYSALEKKEEFLLSVKIAREERAHEKKKLQSIILLQSTIRGWLTRKQYRKMILQKFDEAINDDLRLKPALGIFHLIRQFFSVWNKNTDINRFYNLCRYITKSLEEENITNSYVGVFLLKEHSIMWITQLKEILNKCNLYLKSIFVDAYSNTVIPQNTMIILLHTMVSLTSVNTWRILNTNHSLAENLRILKPGLHQLCNNAVGFLMAHDFYATLKEILRRSFIPVIGMNKLTLTNTCLIAVMTLACRPLIYSDFVDHVMLKFIENILSIPALIHHVYSISPQFFRTFEESELLIHIMEFIKDNSQSNQTEDCSMFFSNDLNINESSHLLCFFANFVQLGKIYLEQISKRNKIFDFINTLSFLLVKCQSCVMTHRSSNLTQWHPILGWFSQDGYDMNLHESLPIIKKQLSLLWSKSFISVLLENPVELYLCNIKIGESSSSVRTTTVKNNFGRKALSLLVDTASVNVRWKSRETEVNSEVHEIKCTLMVSCGLYNTMINTFIQLRLDILTGLCYQSNVLILLWKYFLSQNGGLKFFYRYVTSTMKSNELSVDFNSHILLLFSECMIHYITILDDVEMYEQQSLFHLTDFLQLSSFLNNFLYKGIVNDIFRKEDNDEIIHRLYTNLHRLLMVLYLRDCRRPYTSSRSHWIIKEIKPSSFFHDLDKNNKKMLFLKDQMPHVISYQDRVHLFKKHIFADKCRLREQLFQHSEGTTDFVVAPNFPLPVRIIKIRRNRIVEDAFFSLHKLNSVELKQAFRVKFLNEEGLEEAGIDQAGIFKEFMVDLIKKLFDLSLNLFQRTSNGHVYPSPMTNISELNHLDLMEFSGKMLAKAIHEGIVLDVRLASFFLSQILGQTQSTLYSYLDDLPSLDEELFRSLMYVKRFEGDVSDLCLTFSTTEDYFGTIVTRELVPGGKVINVTEYNKIIYIHLMAYFRMHTQIKQQTIAFARGFHYIFSKDSLNLFSIPELQLLISGEDEPLNFDQLRSHTQYYGGFHDSHKVIVWLWDILKNDFKEEERGLFLKFVTSSSKPPVLGFAFLNPPFSIRCVEVSEDEDFGDSIGSVIRGFFTIRKKGPEHRLPTSSTCFNLLKLPNYSRKSILRDKLRYAITANSGFELS